jgi:geranylgeranyl diphosphate synthase, type II
MHSFKDLAAIFAEKFTTQHFPAQPENLYHPSNYFLQIGGKRVRPVLCLMGNELFDAIVPDAFHVANAIELFHNFSLVHDDIMDEAPLRRGFETIHTKYNLSTALLSGDVMLIKAYEYLNSIQTTHLHPILHLFNKTATEVCEGQMMDMDFEKQATVNLQDYIKMIELKTSVLLACSLQMGSILGGASEGNRQKIYRFGLNLGIAFQIQDDYLDAYGNPEKFGKDVGGDIKQNKKTFLLLHALEVANPEQKQRLQQLMQENPTDKVEQVLQIFTACNVDAWAKELKDKYLQTAFTCLDDIVVASSRKHPLIELANFLVQRDY